MKLKKLPGIFALFAFLFVIAMLPSKAVNAEDIGKITLGQAITIEKNESKDCSIDLQAGQIIYIDRSVYNAHFVKTGQYDYNEPEYSVSAYFYASSDDIETIDDNVYLVKKAGTYSFYAYATYKGYYGEYELTESEGGTVTVMDGTQALLTKQTKGTSMGNNVFVFTPKLSGTYAFTAKTAYSAYGSANVKILTYDGKTLHNVPSDIKSDANYSFCSGFNFWTTTATLNAGTTYYIVGSAYNTGNYNVTYTEDEETYTEEEDYRIEKGYTLSITQSPSVSVNKVTISKATSPKSKKIKVTWKKAAGVNGYEISYSRNKSMKNAKTVRITGNTTKSKVIKGLSKKKTYYVRIRAYRTVEGNDYYGSYSKKLKVKTK